MSAHPPCGPFPAPPQVLEELFGSGLHTELIRRCSPVLEFLADARRLTPGHLDLVWAAARGKHEAVTTVLYGLLAGVVRRLDSGTRAHVGALVRSLPFAEWTPHVMALVRDFAVEATESDGCVVVVGVVVGVGVGLGVVVGV